MIDSETKVAIFVDSLDEELRRYNYWEDYLRRRGVCPHLVSIPDLAVEAERFRDPDDARNKDEVVRRLPRLDKYDVIILNWDVANGDYAFGADKTLSYFETRGREELIRWASQGARVVVELQSQAGFPVQQCYDAVLGADAVAVTPFQPQPSLGEAEDELYCSSRRTHPIARELLGHGDSIQTSYEHFDHIPFPHFDAEGSSSFAKDPGKLSWGHFRMWARDWHPIVFRPRPTASSPKGDWVTRLRDRLWGRCVALAKPIGDRGGEIVVTTMRIANSSNDDLIDAFVDFGEKQRKLSRAYYREDLRASLFRRIMTILFAWLIGIGIILPVVSYHTASANEHAKEFFKSGSLGHITGIRALDSFATKYFGDLDLFDVTAFAVLLLLTKVTGWLWKLRRLR